MSWFYRLVQMLAQRLLVRFDEPPTPENVFYAEAFVVVGLAALLALGFWLGSGAVVLALRGGA